MCDVSSRVVVVGDRWSRWRRAARALSSGRLLLARTQPVLPTVLRPVTSYAAARQWEVLGGALPAFRHAPDQSAAPSIRREASRRESAGG